MIVLAAAVALHYALLPGGSVAADGTATGLGGGVSLQVLAPAPGAVITTPTLAIDLQAVGYKLDAAFAGSPNLPHTGHYHEILDGRLVDMTPLHGPNTDAVSMAGVLPGSHVLTLVPANDDHSKIMAAAVNIPFTYAGPYVPLPAAVTFPDPPSIAISAPAAGATVSGPSFFMTVSTSNFVLCGECFGKDNVTGVGHWHVFVDQPMMANMRTMASDSTQEVPLKGLTPGWHTFYAVLVNNQHMPFMGVPSTMSAVTLYVAQV